MKIYRNKNLIKKRFWVLPVYVFLYLSTCYNAYSSSEFFLEDNEDKKPIELSSGSYTFVKKLEGGVESKPYIYEKDDKQYLVLKSSNLEEYYNALIKLENLDIAPKPIEYIKQYTGSSSYNQENYDIPDTEDLLIMEFVDGGDINDLLRQEQLSYEEKCDIALQIKEANQKLKEHLGYNHGDAHLGNIVYSKKENGYKIKLIDFTDGFASYIKDDNALYNEFLRSVNITDNDVENYKKRSSSNQEVHNSSKTIIRETKRKRSFKTENLNQYRNPKRMKVSPKDKPFNPDQNSGGYNEPSILYDDGLFDLSENGSVRKPLMTIHFEQELNQQEIIKQ